MSTRALARLVVAAVLAEAALLLAPEVCVIALAGALAAPPRERAKAARRGVVFDA